MSSCVRPHRVLLSSGSGSWQEVEWRFAGDAPAATRVLALHVVSQRTNSRSCEHSASVCFRGCLHFILSSSVVRVTTWPTRSSRPTGSPSSRRQTPPSEIISRKRLQVFWYVKQTEFTKIRKFWIGVVSSTATFTRPRASNWTCNNDSWCEPPQNVSMILKHFTALCFVSGCEHDSLPLGGVGASAEDRPAGWRIQTNTARVQLPARLLSPRRKGLIQIHS